MEEGNERRYACQSCGQVFKTAQALASHEHYKCGNPAAAGEEAPEESAPPKRALATRPQPLDAVIEGLRLPEVTERYNGTYNIYVAGFNDGVMHGARSILAGIRAAQELSAMGVQQATPLIKMAQEMRQAEGQAAGKAVAEMLERVMPYLEQRLNGLEQSLEKKPDIASVPNPMQGFMARSMESLFGQLTRAFGFGGSPGESGQQEIPGFVQRNVSQ